MPQHGEQRRRTTEPRHVLPEPVEVRLEDLGGSEVVWHPVLESAIDVDEHAKADREENRRRLLHDCRDGLHDSGLRGRSGDGDWLRVLEQEDKRNRPQNANASEDLERQTPAVRAELSHPSAGPGAADDADIEANLEKRERRRP